MAYVMSFYNKYFGEIFADTADGKTYTDKPAKAHRFATEQDITPEAKKNFARVATGLYNQLAPDNHTFRPGSVRVDDASIFESKETTMKCSMLKKKEALSRKNEDASLDGIVQKVSDGLNTVQSRLESSANDKEMSDGYWLHLDFDGVLDNRVTGVTDSTHYDVGDYEWEPDETQEIPCRIYRLSVDPGIYDDDGKFVNDNNMSSISYDICVEVAPDGEDITLDILKSENKFGSKSSTITRSLSFSCDSDGVSDMVDSVVDRVINDLGNYDYLG